MNSPPKLEERVARLERSLIAMSVVLSALADGVKEAMGVKATEQEGGLP